MTDIYRAIADPIRRKILTSLSNKELTQSDIVALFAISQPAIKKHLSILLEENLIAARREGKYSVYRLKKDVFKLHYQKVQDELGNILENKLESLKYYLEEEKSGENH
jgi:DNA-binding transcriptional ArsR family regulator